MSKQTHVAAAIDNRSYDEIYQNDMQPFIQLQSKLDALMPAHVIYEQVDSKPAGFSEFWVQHILRKELKFDGVLFSDDLTMQAACVAGGADARIQAALQAGCDMGLVCNDRTAARLALSAIQDFPLPDQQRLNGCAVKSQIFYLNQDLNWVPNGNKSNRKLKHLKPIAAIKRLKSKEHYTCSFFLYK